MWAGDCRAGVIGEGESLPAVEATLKTSLTSEELSRVHKLKNLESLQTWVSINVRNSCYLHCLKAEKTSPVEGLKIGPILAKPPKSAKVVDFGNWHWFPQSIESNTPPLVLLDLWSSSFNWTTNINSNSSTMPNVHFLSTAPSCFKTYFPCFLQYAVLVTVPFTFVLLLSSGGGGKGGEPWGVGGPQPKKRPTSRKEKRPTKFPHPLGLRILDFACWISDFSSEFLPKFGFFEDIPRPRQLGLVDSWTILPAGPAVVLISWLVPPLPFHCRAALLRNGAVTRSSTRSPTRWCGLLALTSP